MSVFNKVDFIRNEIKDLPDIDKKVTGGIGSFCSKIGYAISLTLKEKEIFFFAFLQWVAIAWLPLWVTPIGSLKRWQKNRLRINSWLGLCLCGYCCLPHWYSNGLCGCYYFLHKQGQQSTIAQCLKLDTIAGHCGHFIG